MRATRDWLGSLEVGSDVWCVHGGNGRPERVTRVTATQVVVGRDRYRRKDGLAIKKASGWYGRGRIEPPTQERRDTYEHAMAAARLRHVKWDDLPLSVLRDVVGRVAAATPPKGDR